MLSYCKLRLMDESPIKKISLKDKLKLFFSNRTNAMLVAGLIILVVAVAFGVQQILLRNQNHGPLQEVDLPFDANGPYALLSPRRDGNAINLHITRVSSYDAIHYELSYQSKNDTGEAIDRGVTGDVNTKDKKSDYTQEILFGTCSRGNTMDPLHCVFDKNVENGTLTLKIQKGNILYKMNTSWHFQKPDIALGVLTSGDSHFKYVVQGASESAVLVTSIPTPMIAIKNAKTTPTPTSSFSDDLRQKLSLVGYSLINDLSGVPKLPNGKDVTGKVYALNVPDGKQFMSGTVSIELAQNPPANAKLGYFKVDGSSWQLLDTKVESAKLSAQAPDAGIFAVLIDATSPQK